MILQTNYTLQNFLNIILLLFFCGQMALAHPKDKHSNSFLIKALNGQLIMQKDSTVIDSTFLIQDHPLESYKGQFKNGSPYEGYFKKNIPDHKIVDYYENGLKVYQYSNDYFKRMEEEENGLVDAYYSEEGKSKERLDITSVYKNGKIDSGYEYTEHHNGFITMKISQGKVEMIHIDVFAMHYFNRITIVEVNGIIEVTSLKSDNSKLQIENDSDIIKCSLLINSEIVGYKTNQLFSFNEVPKNSRVQSSISENEPLTVIMFREFNQDGHSTDHDFFHNIPLFHFMGLNDFYEHLNLLEQKEERSDIKRHPLAYIETNENGTIETGIYWENKNGGQYTTYMNGDFIETEKSTLKDFENIVNQFFEKLYEKD